jgi:FkbM family methyltransferase
VAAIDVGAVVSRLPKPLQRHRLVRLMLALPGASPLALIPFQGTAVYGDLRDSGARLTLFQGRYYPQFTAIAAAFLREGGVFFDVGANIGLTSFSLLPLVGGPALELHLFEANPECCRLLELSARHSGHEATFITNCCVGAAGGTARLSVPAGHTQAGRITEVGDVEVPVVRLDDYAERNAIDRIALLKVDVEGFEPEVLAGAETLLREGRIEAIFTEVSVEAQSKAGFEARTYLDRLRSLGYETFYCRDEDYAAGRPPRESWFDLEVRGSAIPAADATEVAADCHTDVLAVHRTLFERRQVRRSPPHTR